MKLLSQLAPTWSYMVRRAEEWCRAGMSCAAFVAFVLDGFRLAAREAGYASPAGLREQAQDLDAALADADVAEQAFQQEATTLSAGGNGLVALAPKALALVFVLCGEFIVLFLTFADYLGVDLARGVGDSPIQASVAFGLAAILTGVMLVLARAALGGAWGSLDVAASLRPAAGRIPWRRVGALAALLGLGVMVATTRESIGATALFRLVSVLAFPVGAVVLERFLKLGHDDLAAFRECRRAHRRGRQVRRGIVECRRQRRDVTRALERLQGLEREAERLADVFVLQERLVEQQAETAYQLARHRVAVEAPTPFLAPVESLRFRERQHAAAIAKLRRAARVSPVLMDVLTVSPAELVDGDRGPAPSGNGRHQAGDARIASGGSLA